MLYTFLNAALVWDITQRVTVIISRRFGTICPFFKGREILIA